MTATRQNTAGEGPRDRPLAALVRSPATLLVLLAGVVVCRLAVLSSDWGYDTGAWMYISRRMLEGSLPYADVWDNKLPPLYWMGVLYWKTGAPHAAMFLTEVALTTFSALVLAGMLRWAGLAARWALVGGVLFVCASMPAWEYAHRLETYALAPLAAGLALVTRATLDRETSNLGRCVAAGMLIALATAFRAQHGLDAILIGLWILVATGPGKVRHFFAYAGGGFVLTALLAAFVAWRGYLPDMLRDAVLGGAGYASGEDSQAVHSFGLTVWALRTNVDLMPLAWILFGGGCVLSLASWRRLRTEQRSLVVLAFVLFVAQLASTFVAGHQIIHYHFPLGWTAALTCGLALAGSDVRAAEVQSRAPWLAPAVAALLFLATAFPVPSVSTGIYQWVRGPMESRADRLERLVREHVPPDGPLYLLDDYSTAGALARLPNPPAHPRTILAMQARYLDPADPPAGTSPYGLTTLSWGRQIRAEMEREPPPWLVRQTGIADELTPWVQAQYDEVASTAEFTVWRLREETPR